MFLELVAVLPPLGDFAARLSSCDREPLIKWRVLLWRSHCDPTHLNRAAPTEFAAPLMASEQDLLSEAHELVEDPSRIEQSDICPVSAVCISCLQQRWKQRAALLPQLN